MDCGARMRASVDDALSSSEDDDSENEDSMETIRESATVGRNRRSKSIPITKLDTKFKQDKDERRLRRNISTSKDLRALVSLKEGYLSKQNHSFQRWRKRYFKLKGRKLYYAKDEQAVIFNEVDLVDLSVAECGSKHAHAFQVITPFASLILCAETRKEMDEWVQALKTVGQCRFYECGDEQFRSATSGQHTWYVSSHPRPTYCNVCKEALSGVAWHGLSCEVCKMKTHKRCAVKVAHACKWTTLNSIPETSRVADDEGFEVMPHQWLEGNLPMSAKCAVCERTCGSVLRLQDWRCLWCRVVVHEGSCRDSYPRRCPLGPARLSILPPAAISHLGHDGAAVLAKTRLGLSSPLLVLVNSKSGDNQGVKVLRRFKRLLNPAQVFDLMGGGPDYGLLFFKIFDSFRILVCGGDGSVGWVLAALDRLELHHKSQVGILPLGTGNDLARVLGWGNAFDENTHLQNLLERFERAHTEMLDRWSILMHEGPTLCSMPRPKSSITKYEDSVATHLSKILSSDEHSVVISSAKVLCETVKDFLTKVSEAHKSDQDSEDSISNKCGILQQKLDSLLQSLEQESDKAEKVDAKGIEPEGSSSDSVPEISAAASGRMKQSQFVQNEALMSRANSLKKAVRQIIEHAERAVDEQNRQTLLQRRNVRKKRKFYQRRSKTTPGSLMSTASKQSSLDSSIYTPPVSPYSQNLAGQPDESSTSAEHSPRLGFPPLGHPNYNMGNIRFDLESDSTVPEDPKISAKSSEEPSTSSLGRLQPPSLVRVEPPTPLCLTPSESRMSLSSQGEQKVNTSPSKEGSEPCGSRGLQAPSLAGMRRATFRTESTESAGELNSQEEEDIWAPKRSSDSELHQRIRGNSSFYDIRPSFSDSSILNLETTPDSSRKISKGSTLRLFQRAPSPQRGFLPAFRRGLLASGLTGGSLIAEVLLLNADVLGVAASPLMDFEDVPREQYHEKKVMNNYFGIGLDAKIALEFDQKRELHGDKARSRSKLYMWYGMLGTKELLQRTYKNLEQIVHLECDGHRLQLPSLQGIVILNIPSYQGGMNFWGSTKDDSTFSAQSYDDKILEVVAVFGVIHCATSRVVKLQNHRIAQCRSVKIIITGDEPIPVQVDGEPWMQPPGYILIEHKNRSQVLVRNRQFEAALKTWKERQARDEQKPPACLLQMFTEEESRSVLNFVESSHSFVNMLKRCVNPESELAKRLSEPLTMAATGLQRMYPPARKLPELTHLHYHLMDTVACVKQLVHLTNRHELEKCLKEEEKKSVQEMWEIVVVDLKLVSRLLSISQSTISLDQTGPSTSSPELFGRHRMKSPLGSKSTNFRPKAKTFTQWLRTALPKFKSRESRSSMSRAIAHWSMEDVGDWLIAVGLSEYRENFMQHEISGGELLRLERRDLKDLGVTKVGHIKRLQNAIQELADGKHHSGIETLDESVSSV